MRPTVVKCHAIGRLRAFSRIVPHASREICLADDLKWGGRLLALPIAPGTAKTYAQGMDDKEITVPDIDDDADGLEIETISHEEAERLQEAVREKYRPAFEALRDR